MSKIVNNIVIMILTKFIMIIINSTCKTLNSMGNFYRVLVTITKHAINDYLKNNPIPKLGKVIRDESFLYTITKLFIIIKELTWSKQCMS